MTDETTLGQHGLGELAHQVLQDWRQGEATHVEGLETCECCGGLLGFEDPKEREMAEQWTSFQGPERAPSGTGVGDLGTGWPADMPTGRTGWSDGDTGWGGALRLDDVVNLI